MRWNPIWWLGWISGAITSRYRHGHYQGFQKVCHEEHAKLQKALGSGADTSAGEAMQQRSQGGGLFLVLDRGDEPPPANMAGGPVPPKKEMN